MSHGIVSQRWVRGVGSWETLAWGFHAIIGILPVCGLIQRGREGSLGRRMETSVCCGKRRVDMWEGNMAGQGFQDWARNCRRKKNVKKWFSVCAVLQSLMLLPRLLLFLRNVICVSAWTQGLYPASLGKEYGISVAVTLPSVVVCLGKLGASGT